MDENARDRKQEGEIELSQGECVVNKSHRDVGKSAISDRRILFFFFFESILSRLSLCSVDPTERVPEISDKWWEDRPAPFIAL